MIATIFLCMMKSHLFAMFMWNFTTISLFIAEILLFIKRWSKIAVSNIASLRLANIDVSVYVIPHSIRTTLLPLKLLRCWAVKRQISSRRCSGLRIVRSPDLNPVDYEIWGRLQERAYRWRIRDVNHLKERLVEEWCDLHHNIICAAVNRLRACVRAYGGHFEHQL